MKNLGDAESKLKKLLPLLSSDQPGEVFNAAQAITRVLKANKLDWHDVVNSLFKNDSYQQYKEQKTYRQPKYEEEEEETSWRKTENGNFWGNVGGYNSTIYRSKRNPNLWDAVVNISVDKPVWFYGFKTVEEAKEKLRRKYASDDPADEWA